MHRQDREVIAYLEKYARERMFSHFVTVTFIWPNTKMEPVRKRGEWRIPTQLQFTRRDAGAAEGMLKAYANELSRTAFGQKLKKIVPFVCSLEDENIAGQKVPLHAHILVDYPLDIGTLLDVTTRFWYRKGVNSERIGVPLTKLHIRSIDDAGRAIAYSNKNVEDGFHVERMIVCGI